MAYLKWHDPHLLTRVRPGPWLALLAHGFVDGLQHHMPRRAIRRIRPCRVYREGDAGWPDQPESSLGGFFAPAPKRKSRPSVATRRQGRRFQHIPTLPAYEQPDGEIVLRRARSSSSPRMQWATLSPRRVVRKIVRAHV